MARNKNERKLIHKSVKIDPIYIKMIIRDVKRKKFNSLNHGINAAILFMYKRRMSNRQREQIKKINFGRTNKVKKNERQKSKKAAKRGRSK